MNKILMTLSAGLIAVTSVACTSCGCNTPQCQCTCHMQTQICTTPGCTCPCHANTTTMQYNYRGVSVTIRVPRQEQVAPAPQQPTQAAQPQPQYNPQQVPPQQYQQQPQPVAQQPMANPNGYPIRQISQVWVEGKYVDAITQDGRLVKSFVPGHYEECLVIGQ